MTIPPDRVTVNNLFIKRPNIHVGTTGTPLTRVEMATLGTPVYGKPIATHSS